MKRLGNDCESHGTAPGDCAYQKQTKVIRKASSAASIQFKETKRF